MDNQVYFIRGHDRVPIRFEVFKHGGGIYLAISNQAENVNLALLGSAATMVVQLRLVADLIEAAVAKKDQGHITRPENQQRRPVVADLNGDPRHDFPIFVRRFAKSSPDIVAAIAQVYKSRGYKVPGAETILQGFDDLEVVSAIRHRIIGGSGELVYGGRNRIAKALDIRDAGNYRQRIDTVIWLLKSTVEAPLEDSEVELENSKRSLEDLAGESAVSNTPRTLPKAANE